jgi:DNA-binding winged helix-turn-helix (wHTH) protein
VTIRLLADREPYASFAEKALPEGDALVCGPPALDAAPPDIVVMPASDFLAAAGRMGIKLDCIAYGPVALMDTAFEQGCVDYLREPWSLPELEARLRRVRNSSFRAGSTLFRLKGSVLTGDGPSVELRAQDLGLFRLLLRNAPLLVTREAAAARIQITVQGKNNALGPCVVSLRRSLESVAPGLGRRLHAVKGLGYRFDVEFCG